MRYHLLFVIPYVTVVAVFAFGFGVIQRDERQIKAIQAQSCEDRRHVYALLANGMRRRAVFADAYVTAKNEKPYGKELRREAHEIETIIRALPDCGKP